MASPTFDIIDDSWLDVLGADGSIENLSLRKLLENSHRIARLSESSPLTEVALLRFLIALVSDGLRERIPSEGHWQPFFEECRDGLPSDAIEAILAPLVGRSDVLNSEHDMFFDGPAIREGRRTGNIYPPKDEGSAPTDVLLSIPTGTEISHFHRVEGDGSICVRCLLKGVFAKSLFATGGGGGYSAGAAGAKPALAILLGKSLLNTILLNLVIPDPDDLPSWRRRFSRSLNRTPKTLERMSWRARLYAPRMGSLSTIPCVGCGQDDLFTFTELDRADGFKNTSWATGLKAGDLLGKNSSNEREESDVDPHLVRQEGEMSLKALSATPERGLIGWLHKINANLASYAEDLDRNLPPSHLISFIRAADAVTLKGDLRLALFASLGDPKKMNIEQVRFADVPIEGAALESGVYGFKITGVATHNTRTITALEVDSASGSISSESESTRFPGEALLYAAAKILIQRLSRLSPRELATLRPLGLGGSPDVATRQAAFEAIWHRGGLPSNSRRHVLREALATVAPIYALYSESHRPIEAPRTFELRLYRMVNSERRAAVGQVSALLAKIVTASASARDDLLKRLVGAILKGPADQQNQRVFFDFSDLMFDIARWNDPIDPTPVRWRRFLTRELRESVSS